MKENDYFLWNLKDNIKKLFINRIFFLFLYTVKNNYKITLFIMVRYMVAVDESNNAKAAFYTSK